MIKCSEDIIKLMKSLENIESQGDVNCKVIHNQIDRFILMAKSNDYIDFNNITYNSLNLLQWTAISLPPSVNAKLLRSEIFDPSVVDSDENTLYHLTAKLNNSIQKSFFIKILKEYNVNINAVNNIGETALHIAVSNKHINTVYINKLIEYGVNVNIKDKYGNTASHSCLKNVKSESEGQYCAILALSQKGCDFHHLNNENMLPLHILADKIRKSRCLTYSLEYSIILLSKKIKPQQDIYGNTPLHYIAMSTYKDIENVYIDNLLCIIEYNNNLSLKEKNKQGKTPLNFIQENGVDIYKYKTLKEQLERNNDEETINSLISKRTSNCFKI